MNHLAIASFLVFLVSLANAAFVFLSSPRDLLKSLWGLISIIVSVIGIHLCWLFSTSDAAEALTDSLILNYAAIFIPVLFFHFTLLLTHRLEVKKNELVVYYLITIAYAAVVLSCPTLFVEGVKPVLSVKFYPESGVLFGFLPVWMAYLMSYGLILVYRNYRTAPLFRRNQFKYFFVGSAFGLIGGISALLTTMGIAVYPWGIFMIPLSLLIVAYAIVKHQLMDIQIVLRKSLLYTALASLVTVLFFVFVYIAESLFKNMLGYTSNISSLVAVGLITLIIVPIYQLARSSIDKIFYKGSLTQIVQENVRLQENALAMERYKIFGEIAQAVVREMRDPLHAIKEQSYDRALQHHVLIIEETLRQLDQYSKPPIMEYRQLNLIDLVEEMIPTIEEKIKEQEITIFKYYQPEDVARVLGHPGQLKEALRYLFDHCVQMVKKGGDIFVTIEHDRKWTSLSIRHSGKGLTQVEAGSLFEPFFKTNSFNCGLNLVLAQSIIIQHEGKITVESEEDIGTEFLIELPLV